MNPPVAQPASVLLPAGRSGNPARRRSTSGVLAMAALALLCGLHWLALLRAPAAWMPARIDVALAPGHAIVLDGAALGMPGDPAAALRLRRDLGGGWRVAGASAPASAHVSVSVATSGRMRRTAGAALARGQAFQAGTQRFAVDAADAREVAFSGRGAHWRYDGATLLRDGAPQPACPDARPAARVAGLWNRLAPHALTLARPLIFKGNLDCGNRIAVVGLAEPGVAAATAARGADGIVLAAGGALLPFQEADGSIAPLAEREALLDGVTALAVGRTRFAVEIGKGVLHLRPLAHVALHAQAEQALPPGVDWVWTRRGHWTWPGGTPGTVAAAALAGSLLLAGAAALVAGRAGRSMAWRAAGTVLLCAVGSTLLVLQRGAAGGVPGTGISLLAAWAALWYLVAFDRRPGLAAGTGVLLLAVGLLAQLDLGLGAPASSWLRHFHKSAAVLALGAGGVGIVRLLAPAMRPTPTRVEGLLIALAGAALLALLLQVAYGDETGVFDLQPVEFAKLALAALSAHCLALAGGAAGSRAGSGAGSGAYGRPWRRGLRTLAPVLLFLALLAVALVQVDDYSPLVLLCVWGGALALAAALGARRHGMALLLAACACGLVAGVAGLHELGPEGIGAWSARWNFYPDRFVAWLAPDTHPHTGQQVLLGARAVLEGGWTGADGVFGLRALGGDPGPALRIPAVQDDFAPAFFLYRHGLAAGLALWLLQAAFLAGLLVLALRWWQAGAGARDYRAAWQARLRCFCLTGGAAFAFGHFLLSWGTNLAILPVMGQPMSFLSAGGSHLLFFICPLLGLAGAGAPAARRPAQATKQSSE